jgi:chemotaxis protein CheX
MIGGNLKSLIPGTHFLSLPTVVEGKELDLQIPGATLTDDVFMEGANGTLRVRLFVK